MIFIPPSFLSGLICSGRLKKGFGYTHPYSSGEINGDRPATERITWYRATGCKIASRTRMEKLKIL